MKTKIDNNPLRYFEYQVNDTLRVEYKLKVNGESKLEYEIEYAEYLIDTDKQHYWTLGEHYYFASIDSAMRAFHRFYKLQVPAEQQYDPKLEFEQLFRE